MFAVTRCGNDKNQTVKNDNTQRHPELVSGSLVSAFSKHKEIADHARNDSCSIVMLSEVEKNVLTATVMLSEVETSLHYNIMRFFDFATDDVPHFRHCKPAKQSSDNLFIMVLSGLLRSSQ